VETAPGRCPKCGFERQTNAAECPVCGVVFAKAERSVAAGTPHGSPERAVEGPAGPAAAPRPAAPPPILQPRHAPGAPPAGGVDPYAAPRTGIAGPAAAAGAASLGLADDSTDGIWCSGKLIVIGRNATLPNRCVRCGAPAETRIRTRLAWHSPWLYLLLVGPLLYVLVALVVRQTARVEIPLCGRHRRRRSRARWISFGILVACLPVGYAAGVWDQAWLGWTAAFLAFIGLVAIALAARLLAPKRIDRDRLWLANASPKFLDLLPSGPSLL
jgi:hypothetical protein